ncbi:DUF6932 family protein [Amycolatopsis circi]|uniref:DUF6932 family protein n=1 Tax=Amycolatopsis circi TaxID=871959 RepID=UPI003CC6DAB6
MFADAISQTKVLAVVEWHLNRGVNRGLILLPRSGGRRSRPSVTVCRSTTTAQGIEELDAARLTQPGGWVSMGLPAFDEHGNLVPGVHGVTWAEVKEAYGYNPKRRLILDGLREVLDRLEERSAVRVWVDGSFVTTKLRPRDVDVVYEPPPGAITSEWGILSWPRRDQLKKLYHVDLLPFPGNERSRLGRPITITEFFQVDRDGNKKGIIELTRWRS